jgi:hypothetical protein
MVDRLVPEQSGKRLYSVLKASVLGTSLRSGAVIFEVIEAAQLSQGPWGPRTPHWAYSSVGLEHTPDKREVGSSNLPRPTRTRTLNAECEMLSELLIQRLTSNIQQSSVRRGAVAQLGEHLLCKQGVVGSIPISSTSHRDHHPRRRKETARISGERQSSAIELSAGLRDRKFVDN